MNKSLTEHFEDGYDAFKRVQIRKNKFHAVANPLKKDTTPYREWQRGWNSAYFKNLEKFNGSGARS
jgi:hypothetical protein